MIRPRILRTLEIAATPGAGGPRHLAAGSGLVATKCFLYVVADDEVHLGCFPRSGDTASTPVCLFPGELPPEPAERKRAKPDLEALVRLPAFTNYPDGALLAVPSGSTLQRCRGGLLWAAQTECPTRQIASHGRRRMHSASVSVFQQVPAACGGLLAKAESHAAQYKIETGDVIAAE